MILNDQNLYSIKEFLEQLVPKFTKVDAVDLTKLVLALLVKKENRDKIKKACIHELSVFIKRGAHIDFVNILFDKIDDLKGLTKREKSVRSKSGGGLYEVEEFQKVSPVLDGVLMRDHARCKERDKPKGKRARKSSGRSRDKRRGRKRSREGKKRGKKHSRRRRGSSLTESSAENIVTKKELRKLIRKAMDDNERKQILDSPDLLKSYHKAMNSKLTCFDVRVQEDRCLVDPLSMPIFERSPYRRTVISNDLCSPPTHSKDLTHPAVDPPLTYRFGRSRRSLFKPDTMRRHHTDKRNVLVTGIPSRKNSIASLNQFFSKFGSIQNVQVHAGKRKAFIQFSSVSEARTCVNACKKRYVMDEPKITVESSSHIGSDSSIVKVVGGVDNGIRKAIKYNHDAVQNVFGHEYVSMDRPTSGLYTKVTNQSAKARDHSDSSIKSVCVTKPVSPKLINQPKIITSPRASPPQVTITTSPHTSPKKVRLSKSTSPLRAMPRQIKPITLPKSTISGKLMLPMSLVLDRQIEVSKAQRDKQMEMWERLSKMKGKRSREFCSELSKNVKQLNKKVLLLMEKKKKSLIKRVVSSWTPPSRSDAILFRARGRGRGRGYHKWRGRGKWNREIGFRAGFYLNRNLKRKNDSTTLQIEDLPTTVDEGDLRAHFSRYGELASVDIKDDTAKVKFSTAEQAELALTRGRIYQGLFEGKIILKITHDM